MGRSAALVKTKLVGHNFLHTRVDPDPESLVLVGFFVTDDGRQLAEFNLSSWREDCPFLLKSLAMWLTIIQWKRGAAAGS